MHDAGVFNPPAASSRATVCAVDRASGRLWVAQGSCAGWSAAFRVFVGEALAHLGALAEHSS
jgi:hypothetical protein